MVCIDDPSGAIRQCLTSKKYSLTILSCEFGIKRCVSAIRPALEFSIGTIARSAFPSRTLSNISSNVLQGIDSEDG